jgi:hypothetical protein
MQGFITETDLGQADLAFPGIARFFESLVEKPRTFLELLSLFERWAEPRNADGFDGTIDTCAACSPSRR